MTYLMYVWRCVAILDKSKVVFQCWDYCCDHLWFNLPSAQLLLLNLII